jgi:ParB family transcriptional regulator, chromosome partitioning protein
MPELRHIPLAQIIEPPAPMRSSMDEQALLDLRDSIRAIGLLQPIIVIPFPGDGTVPVASEQEGAQRPTWPPALRFEIVAGHRRYLACKVVPLETMPCMVYEDGSLAKEAAMLAENVYREDITAAEEGWFYCELIEKHTLTEAQLCAMVRQTPEYIYARMDMVRADAEIAQLVAQRKLNFTVAKELLKCKDKEHRMYLANMAAESGATGRVVKSWVQQWEQQQQPAIPVAPGPTGPDAGSPPVQSSMKCWCCGRGEDPQNLRLIYVHWYELDTWNRILRESGLRTVDNPTPASA